MEETDDPNRYQWEVRDIWPALLYHDPKVDQDEVTVCNRIERSLNLFITCQQASKTNMEPDSAVLHRLVVEVAVEVFFQGESLPMVERFDTYSDKQVKSGSAHQRYAIFHGREMRLRPSRCRASSDARIDDEEREANDEHGSLDSLKFKEDKLNKQNNIIHLDPRVCFEDKPPIRIRSAKRTRTDSFALRTQNGNSCTIVNPGQFSAAMLDRNTPVGHP